MTRWTEEDLAAIQKRQVRKATAAVVQLKVPKKSKYRNKPTFVDDIRFPSKLEARRYVELKGLRDQESVKYFLRQVPFHLDGGTKYLLDFLVHWHDGHLTYEDVKGRLTEVYKIKKREVEFKFDIEITEVRYPRVKA